MNSNLLQNISNTHRGRWVPSRGWVHGCCLQVSSGSMPWVHHLHIFHLQQKYTGIAPHNTSQAYLSCHSTQTPSQLVYATTVTALFHNINQRHAHLLRIVELYSRILIQISQKLSGFRTSNAHNPLFHHRQRQILRS